MLRETVKNRKWNMSKLRLDEFTSPKKSTNITKCFICLKNVIDKNLDIHLGLIHFKLHMVKELKALQKKKGISSKCCPCCQIIFRGTTLLKHFISHVKMESYAKRRSKEIKMTCSQTTKIPLVAEEKTNMFKEISPIPSVRKVISDKYQTTSNYSTKPEGSIASKKVNMKQDILLSMDDLAYSQRWGPMIRKQWKKMVLSGTIVSYRYSKEKVCLVSGCKVSSAKVLESFCHIRKHHLEK